MRSLLQFDLVRTLNAPNLNGTYRQAGHVAMRRSMDVHNLHPQPRHNVTKTSSSRLSVDIHQVSSKRRIQASIERERSLRLRHLSNHQLTTFHGTTDDPMTSPTASIRSSLRMNEVVAPSAAVQAHNALVDLYCTSVQHPIARLSSSQHHVHVHNTERRSSSYTVRVGGGAQASQTREGPQSPAVSGRHGSSKHASVEFPSSAAMLLGTSPKFSKRVSFGAHPDFLLQLSPSTAAQLRDATTHALAGPASEPPPSSRHAHHQHTQSASAPAQHCKSRFAEQHASVETDQGVSCDSANLSCESGNLSIPESSAKPTRTPSKLMAMLRKVFSWRGSIRSKSSRVSAI